MFESRKELDEFWNRHAARRAEWQSPGIDRNSIPFALYGDDAGVFEKSMVFGALRGFKPDPPGSGTIGAEQPTAEKCMKDKSSCGDRAGPPEAPTTFM